MRLYCPAYKNEDDLLTFHVASYKFLRFTFAIFTTLNAIGSQSSGCA